MAEIDVERIKSEFDEHYKNLERIKDDRVFEKAYEALEYIARELEKDELPEKFKEKEQEIEEIKVIVSQYSKLIEEFIDRTDIERQWGKFWDNTEELKGKIDDVAGRRSGWF